MALLPGFKGLGGTAKRVLDLSTGKELSRREYAEKVKRQGLLSNEQLAKLNRDTQPEKQILRPTKGRKSAQKLKEDDAKLEAQKRLLEAAKQKRREAELKEQRATAKKIEAKKRKVIKPKKITARLLEPGKQGRRIPFNTYDDYLQMFTDAKATKKIFAYGLGVEGIDSRSGKIVTATIFTMRGFGRPISEDDFNDAMEEFLTERLYFVFTNYFIHLAFSVEYARQKAARKTPKKKKRK